MAADAVIQRHCWNTKTTHKGWLSRGSDISKIFNGEVVATTMSVQYYLTHWGRDKMAAVSQTIFSNAFSWIKMYEFRLKFHWSLILRFKLTVFQHWFRYWLGAAKATSHYLNQWWLVYWRIYASLGLNELIIPATGIGVFTYCDSLQ